MSKPSVTLLLIGACRTADVTLRPLQEHLLNHVKAKILVQCPADDVLQMRSIFPDALIDGWDGFSPESITASHRIGNFKKKDFSFWIQLFRLWRARNIFREELENSHVIVKSRPDNLLFSNLANELNTKNCDLLVPEYNNFCGLNDQIAVGGSAAMLQYMERVQHVARYMLQGGFIHPESFLAESCRGLKIRPLHLAYTLLRQGRPEPVKALAEFGDNDASPQLDVLERHGVPVIRNDPESKHLVLASRSTSRRIKRFASQCFDSLFLYSRLSKMLREIAAYPLM